VLTRSLLAALAMTLSLLAAGCPPSRYASCNTDEECSGRLADGGKLVCYNLRCVECHYDSDCSDGRHCGIGNTCESLDTRTPEAEPGPPPKTLEECAKRCKGDPLCGDRCREQFKEAAPKK
jgi:hypothetical protein